MFGLRVPIISVVIGEGGSGGALAIGARCLLSGHAGEGWGGRAAHLGGGLTRAWHSFQALSPAAHCYLVAGAA